jgi:hypothetical protein
LYSVKQKDFCNSICQEQTSHHLLDHLFGGARYCRAYKALGAAKDVLADRRNCS